MKTAITKKENPNMNKIKRYLIDYVLHIKENIKKARKRSEQK